MKFCRALFCLFSAFLAGFSTAGASVEMPFRFQQGLVCIEVQSGGQALHFLLDSGAGRSVLNLSTAQALGLKLTAAGSVQGVNGLAPSYTAKGFSATLAGVALPPTLLAMNLDAAGRVPGQRIDGLLGADFLRNQITQIDYRRETVAFLTRAEAGRVSGAALPLVRHNDAWCLRMRVLGNRPSLLRLDTGCSSALEWSCGRSFLQKSSKATVALKTGSTQTQCLPVQIGSLQIPQVSAGLHAQPFFAGESGLIGNGLLSRFVVTIDAARQVCYLK
ncbi:MAG: retropepsin-like aspartic protease [Chthoniobacteraceae bacterium]